MPKKLTEYLKEFKLDDVQRAGSGRSGISLAEALGCSPQAISQWLRKYEVENGIRSDGLNSDEREELKKLRREVIRLKQERDLLKRAAVNSMRERNSVRVDQALKGPECRGSVGSTRWRSGGSFGIDGRPGSRQARSRELWIVRRARSMASLSSMVVLPRG